MWILSVDPGNHCGWCLRDGGFLHYGHFNWTGADVEQISCDIWERLGVLQTDHGIDDWIGSKLVVEGQWWNPRTGFDSVARLLGIRCCWEALCALAGFEIEVVSPSTWIKPVTRGFEGKDSTKRITAACRAQYKSGPKGFTDDEAAAIMLGHWWVENRGVGS